MRFTLLFRWERGSLISHDFVSLLEDKGKKKQEGGGCGFTKLLIENIRLENGIEDHRRREEKPAQYALIAI